MEERYLQTERQHVELYSEYDNSTILDIGGGGEGFIGNLYGKNVIAIDQREEELLETNNEAIKLVMDGRELKFTDENFDVVTLFYSLMYMNNETKLKVLKEASRVLKKGGKIDIWDVEVPKYNNDGKDIFVAQLSVKCKGKITTTGYGVLLGANNEHSKLSIENILLELGFKRVNGEVYDNSFRLQYIKSENS